jgi:hypothetical protein
MKWKEFLKPTIMKILILIILFGLSSIFIYPVSITPGMHNEGTRGLPLPFYNCITSVGVLPVVACGFIYPFLIVDILIWYLVSCLMIIWIYNKVKKKK